MRRSMMAGIGAGMLVAVAAHAGIGEPVPSGNRHLYSVPGVINNGLVTMISCTSTQATASQTVSVDWYRKNGTLLGSNSLTVAAGETVIFVTAFTTMYGNGDALLPVNEALKNGSARIRSTVGNGVVCNAFAIDPLSDPPTKLMQLVVTGAKKQKL